LEPTQREVDSPNSDLPIKGGEKKKVRVGGIAREIKERKNA